MVDDQSDDGTRRGGARGGRGRPARAGARRAAPARGLGRQVVGLLAGRATRRAASGCCSPTPTSSTRRTRSAATLAMARRLGRGGLTLFPTIDCAGLRGAGGDARRRWSPSAPSSRPGPLARSPRSRRRHRGGRLHADAARRLYDAVGGHAAIRGRMVDDVCLAARVKRRGALLVPVPGGRLARLRMYHGGREVWDGWSKNASFAAAGGPGKGLAGAGTLAALAVAAGPRRGGRRAPPRSGPRGHGPRRDARAPRAAAPVVVGRAHPGALRADAAAGDPGAERAAVARGGQPDAGGTGAQWRGRRYPLAR